jgi:hypothetical protein
MAAVILGLAIAGVGSWASRHSPSLLRSVARATVPTVREAEIPYFTATDEQSIRRFLEGAAASGPVSVVFYPWSEALLFADLRSSNLRLVQPTFYALQADIVVVRESRHFRHWVTESFAKRARFVQKVDRPLYEWPVILERDGSERWRFFRR